MLSKGNSHFTNFHLSVNTVIFLLQHILCMEVIKGASNRFTYSLLCTLSKSLFTMCATRNKVHYS